jgi:hypothetical protein
MRRVLLSVAASVALCVISGSAAAAVITRTYTFDATNLQSSGGGAPAPVSHVVGSITVTFDPTVAIYDVTSGITLNSLNLPLASAIGFSFTPFGSLTFGGIGSGVAGASSGTDDFEVAFFSPLSDTPVFGGLFYTRSGADQSWGTRTGTVSAVTVPEPSAWALMLAGFFGAGLAVRRRARLALALDAG